MSEATVDTLHEKIASAEPDVVTPTLTERIRERPLLSVSLASLVGFVTGGGAASRTGAAALMLVGRIWLRRAATDALANAMTSKRNGVG
jgi:hypothetical protein